MKRQQKKHSTNFSKIKKKGNGTRSDLEQVASTMRPLIKPITNLNYQSKLVCFGFLAFKPGATKYISAEMNSRVFNVFS